MRALVDASRSTAAVQPYMASSSCTTTFGSYFCAPTPCSSSSMRAAARGTPAGGSAGAATESGGGSGTAGTPPIPNCPEAISVSESVRPSGATRMRCHRMACSSSFTASSSSFGSWQVDMRVRHAVFCTDHEGDSASVFSIDSSTTNCCASSAHMCEDATTATHSLRR